MTQYAKNSLSLTKPTAYNDDTYRLERRQSSRHPVAGRVTALRTHRTVEGIHNKICSLQLLDLSDTGLGAVSSEELELDTPIMVVFPAHGPDRGFDVSGQIVRCRVKGNSYEIGIRFANRLAA